MHCRDLINLAKNATATASSQFLKVYPAGRAIDGITTNNLLEKSCMHTAKDKKPWLRIDLGTLRLVEKVVIHNRADCCSERLNNLLITVGESANGTGNHICGGRDNMEDVKKTTISCCRTLIGRYVHLTIPGPQFLHVCEVEVLGKSSEITNIALGKSASMSSNAGYPAGNAVDGDENTFSHTNHEANPWWKVDLGKDSIVYKVEVKDYNNDGTYSKHAVISVLDTQNVARICGNTGDFRKEVTVVCQTPLLGRYVKLQLHRTDHLIMKEVRVWGSQ
ncbi:pentraxin fusion protein-like isoform X2 [Hydractinia symbiolongicarpus]|nr:pentraxin fusion protein-like isoform X2 [Hydractinia symbiolongicarpus]